jgi:N-acetylmuramoyl-L-alanine amidase
MTSRARRRPAAWLGAFLFLSACSQPTPIPSGTAPGSGAASASALASAQIGEVVPAPGSSSKIFRPNPAAIVVAIDPGHGGCLDWGVPDPLKRGPAFSEKTMTLAIGLELKRLLEAQGVTAVLTRTTDAALAGDDYPALGCHGAPFRDVNGDGQAGFDPEGKTRTRDELQTRLDLVNLARADLLVSIHINSITQGGVAFQIAATETFYTDETAWGVSATQRLAQLVQRGVVTALVPIAAYDRQDRGVSATNLYIVAPPLFVTTPDRPDPLKQPTRGALMPAILTEVGSITLPAEQDLLLSPAGQAAVAQGIAAALGLYFGARPLAVRYDLLAEGGSAGLAPTATSGEGPPFWAPPLTAALLTRGTAIRLTNTGSARWPDGLRLEAAWAASRDPYLRQAPAGLQRLALDVPTLGPGESVELVAPLTAPAGAGRQVAWITLATAAGPLTDLGSPPLQIATGTP